MRGLCREGGAPLLPPAPLPPALGDEQVLIKHFVPPVFAGEVETRAEWLDEQVLVVIRY